MYLYVFVYWQVYLSCSWAWRVTAPQMVGVVKAPQRWKTFTWKVAVLGGLWRFLDTFLRVRSEDHRPSGCCGSAHLSPVLLKISFTPSKMVAVIELAGIWSSSTYNGAKGSAGETPDRVLHPADVVWFFVTWKSNRWQPVSVGIFELSPVSGGPG